jgi:hypothetical protein
MEPQIIKVTPEDVEHSKTLLDGIQRSNNLSAFLQDALQSYFQRKYGIDKKAQFTVDMETLELRIDL